MDSADGVSNSNGNMSSAIHSSLDNKEAKKVKINIVM